jgi:hypothetical protein
MLLLLLLLLNAAVANFCSKDVLTVLDVGQQLLVLLDVSLHAGLAQRQRQRPSVQLSNTADVAGHSHADVHRQFQLVHFARSIMPSPLWPRIEGGVTTVDAFVLCAHGCGVVFAYILGIVLGVLMVVPAPPFEEHRKLAAGIVLIVLGGTGIASIAGAILGYCLGAAAGAGAGVCASAC